MANIFLTRFGFESAEEPHKIAMGAPSPQATPCFGGISAVERHYSAFRKDKANPLEFIHSRGHLPDKHSPIMTRLR